MKTIRLSPTLMILLVSVFFFQLSFSQSIGSNTNSNEFTFPEIVRPSPTVAQLMKFEEVQLSHYTGQPNISIPLFNKNLYGLNYNLTLQYQVSGIRVNEQSGWVGKGWALDAAGVISRSVVGLPDEINIPSKFIGVNYNEFHNYFDWDRTRLELPHYGVNGNIILDTDARNIFDFDFHAYPYGYVADNIPKLDYQPDIYQFNFFGHTARFRFTKNTYGNIAPVIIGKDSKIQIEVIYGQGADSIDGYSDPYPTVIDSFIITNDAGYKFTFDIVEITKEETYTITAGAADVIVPVSGNNIPRYRSAWKLSKVESPNSMEILSIAYDDVIENPKTRPTFINFQARRETIPLGEICSAPLVIKPSNIFNYQTLAINSKKVNEINFADNVKLKFETSEDHPEYEGGVQLDKISVNTPFNTANRSYRFLYDEHMKEGVSDDSFYQEHNHKLLFLNEITVNNSSMKYTFDYINKENLRSYNNKTTGYDVFGYFFDHNVPFKDYASKERVNSGALTKITYPTGGSRKFNWESNTYSYKGGQLLSFEEIFENPDNYTNNHFQFSYTSSLSGGTPDDAFFFINPKQIVTINHNIIAQTDPNTPNLYSYGVEFTPIVSRLNPTTDSTRDLVSFGYSGDSNINSNKVFFEAGWYKISLIYNLNHLQNSPYTLQLDFERKLLNPGPLNWWVYGGGLRINSIEDIDKNDTKIKTAFNFGLEPEITTLLGQDILTFPTPLDYPGVPRVGADPNPTHYFSSGSYDGESSIVRKYTFKTNPNYNAGIGDTFGTSARLDPMYSPPITYDVREFQSSIQAQMTQGEFIGYKNVAKYKVDLGTHNIIGNLISNVPVTKYIFDSPIDNPSYPENYGYPFLPIKNNDYLRGNIRKQLHYDADNNMVKEVLNSYNYDQINIENIVTKSLHYVLDENLLVRTDFVYNAYIPTLNRQGIMHNVRKPIAMILKDLYLTTGGFLNNFPTNRQYEQLICGSFQSNFAGSILSEIRSYGPHYTHTAIKNLTTDMSYIIDEFSYKVQLTSSTSKDYFYDESGNQTETEIKENITYNPLNYQVSEKEVIINKSGDQEYWLTKFYYPTSTIFYNPSLINLNKINEILAIEQYNDSELLSTLVNTYKTFQPNQILLEKIQFQKGVVEPPVGGGPFNPLDDLEDRLIYHDYDDYGNPLEVSKADGTHIVYIWGYHQTQPIAKIENATYTQIENLINGLDLQTKSNADDDRTLGYTGNEGTLREALDNLRANLNGNQEEYPNAMVTTYTYDPLIGVTSITDPRGDVVYYHYDDLNRLKHVKDKDGNILSKNEYHYRNPN